ncbi:LysE family transporter [Mesorhizobium sp.]|uniref:LysE family transporter n=1 Tax=Mesorhizobium sp. TaxID=1871066 RepID=UPI00121EB061|nr:LysE family transporter [Mesorhizobium sp.]TIO09699.1 MAG: lysine transporter LysE [Mesorhizobium sp.]TIO34190.1 MAG: lysine transporter LysE [Mesorhizobium sp.]TIP11887.1 MAG: lysine transporter LysE [Mesorhizobium sp.]
MLETGHAVAAGLFPFAISYALVAMLPGANFAVVAQAGLTASRATALSAAAGIALGATSLAAVVATGAGALLSGGIAHQMGASLYGAMLVFIGWNSMRRALSIKTGVTEPKPVPIIRYFRLGFVTAVANPATALFFASSTLNLNARGTTHVSVVGLVFAIAIAWFGLLGLSISQPATQRFYNRFRKHADIVLGGTLVALGFAAFGY